MSAWEIGWGATTSDEKTNTDDIWGLQSSNVRDNKPVSALTENWRSVRAEVAAIGEEEPNEDVERHPEDVKIDPQSNGWVPPESSDNVDSTDQSSERLLPDWSSKARKYEWKDEYGDTGPEDTDLEKDLFEDTHRPQMGEHYKILRDFKVEATGPEDIRPILKLEHAGLHPQVWSNLKRSKYQDATPIQAWTIPAALTGQDILAVAQTGSGKTVAYLAPVISKLMGKADQLCKPKPNPAMYNPKKDGITAEPLVLIFVPTRELALQVYHETRRLCYRSKLRSCTVYGGAEVQDQVNDLMRGCDILIGTPGRVGDFVEKKLGVLSMKRLRHVIFDEADRMMDDQWKVQMVPILTGANASLSDDCQFMMFSATFGQEELEAAKMYLHGEYIKITVGRLGSSHSNIHQVILPVSEHLKEECLSNLLMHLKPERTIIFCGSISRVDDVDDFLFRLGFPVVPLHSHLGQRQREDFLTKFRRGTSPILVTTSVGARGLDIGDVHHVINFDLPAAQYGGINAYNHQIGRTGRIGNRGQATSFYDDRNEDIREDLVKTLIECDHTVPDFLIKTPGEPEKWNDRDEDFNFKDVHTDQDNGGEDSSPGWGASNDKADASKGWGSDRNTAISTQSW